MVTFSSLIKANGGLPFLVSLTLFTPFPSVNAASFDCSKASTLVENAICADAQLSARDDALLDAYKQALVNAPDANRLKADQRAWLKNVRNKCQNVKCLIKVYDQRLAELGGGLGSVAKVSRPDDPSIVMGRCHMDGCSWWKVASVDTVSTGAKGRLLKVKARMTYEEFSSDYVDQHGYPDNPKSTAKWEEITEVILFCSKTLPAVLDYDEERRKYRVTIPFDNNGDPWGYTESAANLYNHACNHGQSSTYAINPAYAEAEIFLDVPEDILSFR